MPYTDAIDLALLDHFFGDPTYTADTTMFAGLSSTTPTDAGGNVTEPSNGGYARQACNNTNMGAAAGTAPGAKANDAIITYGVASANYNAAPVTHMTLHDAATVGTVLGFAALTTSKTVLSGDTASFAVGALVFRQGKGTPT